MSFTKNKVYHRVPVFVLFGGRKDTDIHGEMFNKQLDIKNNEKGMMVTR